jgi:RNA polymerase sigma-70 factor (ECF subfamily)
LTYREIRHMPSIAPIQPLDRPAAVLRARRLSHGPSLDAEPTNSSLLRRVRDVADEASWAEFVARYEPVLLAYVRRRGLNEHDARDVVQEVFLRLHRALPAFRLDRARGRFRTWLWQVASSALSDWARVQRRQAQAEQGWWDQQAPGPITCESETDGPAAQRRRMLEQALRQVQARSQPRTWACFEQRVLRGRPSATIAAELGLTATAVNVNASRTLARLRKQCDAVRGQADAALPTSA